MKYRDTELTSVYIQQVRTKAGQEIHLHAGRAAVQSRSNESRRTEEMKKREEETVRSLSKYLVYTLRNFSSAFSTKLERFDQTPTARSKLSN